MRFKMDVNLVKVNNESVKTVLVPYENSFKDEIRHWSRLVIGKHPQHLNSADFAALACARYNAFASKSIYVSSPKEYEDHVTNNPREEICMLKFLRLADYDPKVHGPGATIGVVHFRRTWCNNVCIDYLCSRPDTIRIHGVFEPKIVGVGSTLLTHVFSLLKPLRVPSVWLETTQNSVGFYKYAFDLNELRDLLQLSAKQRTDFLKGNYSKARKKVAVAKG